MIKVYLKNNKFVKVKLKNLENFLFSNADNIETRFHKRLRPPVVEENER